LASKRTAKPRAPNAPTISKPGTRSQARAVLVLTQFHAPEPCAAANRVGALTAALEEAGYDVDVVTGFANFPDGVLAPSDRILVRTEQLSARVRLSRVFTYASARISGRSRILNWLSVACAMTFFTLFTRRRFAIIIVTMPPISLAIPAFAALLRHRARLIVDVRDVFPDVAVKMGYWREGSPIVRIVGSIAGALYRRSKLILCVTDAARAEIIARGIAPSKVVIAANGFDPIQVAPESPYARSAGDFVVVFVGNMGLATGLDTIIDAADLLRDEPRIRFVLAGGGADKDRLSLRVAELRLDNVVMLGVVTRPAANALVAAADVSVVPLHAGIVDSLPTKMFDALVLGCPVVCCANGEARAFIESSGGGIAVAPNDGAALARALRELLANPGRRGAYAVAGREFVLNYYDRAKIMREMVALLPSL
jgi:glycosyltransferase involved in cell wall biosynthesis